MAPFVVRVADLRSPETSKARLHPLDLSFANRAIEIGIHGKCGCATCEHAGTFCTYYQDGVLGMRVAYPSLFSMENIPKSINRHFSTNYHIDNVNRLHQLQGEARIPYEKRPCDICGKMTSVRSDAYKKHTETSACKAKAKAAQPQAASSGDKEIMHADFLAAEPAPMQMGYCSRAAPLAVENNGQIETQSSGTSGAYSAVASTEGTFTLPSDNAFFHYGSGDANGPYYSRYVPSLYHCHQFPISHPIMPYSPDISYPSYHHTINSNQYPLNLQFQSPLRSRSYDGRIVGGEFIEFNAYSQSI